MPRRPARAILLSLAALALAFLIWDEAIKPHVLPKRFAAVTPNQVYRSGKLTPATMRAVVNNHDIRTIIDLGAWVHDPRGERLEARTAAALNTPRHVFDLSGDSTGDPNDYVAALRLMTDPDNQPVLVHCGAGTERTGVVVYLYRTIAENKPKEEALAEARRAGHDPRRNPHLRETIDRWEDDIARAFRDGGTIALDAAASSEPPAEAGR